MAWSLLLGLLACAHLRHRAEPAPSLDASEVGLLDAGAADEPLPLLVAGTPTGDAVLRRPALAVDPGDASLARIEGRMRATLEAAQGVGLAAPQVGIARRVILVERQDVAPPGGEAPVEIYLNPRVTWRSDAEVVGWEGCLSVPGWRGEVARAGRIRVAWDRPGGGAEEAEIAGWTARIFQHEIDHLDGILMVDRALGDLLDEAAYQARKRAAQAAPAALAPE